MAGHTKSLWSFLPLCSEGNGKDMFSFVWFLKPDNTRKWNYSGLFLIRKNIHSTEESVLLILCMCVPELPAPSCTGCAACRYEVLLML